MSETEGKLYHWKRDKEGNVVIREDGQPCPLHDEEESEQLDISSWALFLMAVVATGVLGALGMLVFLLARFFFEN